MNRIAFLLGTLLTLSLSQTASAAVELYKQNFDAFTPCSTTCGAACVLGESWENDPADNVPNRDWATDFGGTPSSPTGPSDDRTGGGNYLYFESSSSCGGSDTANVTSPVIDLTSTVSPGVSFWYHMYGSSMGDLHVDILDENKNVLQLDVIPSITDNKDEWQNASFPIVAYIGQKIRVRFRGVSGSSYWSDMAIDDFEAFDLVPDVGITSLGGPKQQACGTSAANIVVNVSNFGAEAVDVPVEVTLSGAVNTVLNATLPGVLAFGETKKLELGPVDLLNGGTLSVSAKTVLMGDTDTANDTYEDDVQIKSAVIPVAPPAATVCPGSSAVFAATLEADASAVWFDANDGGNLIGLGSIFSTPETASTTSYYVGRLPGIQSSVGIKNGFAGGASYDYVHTRKTAFTVKTPISLSGVYVYPETMGDVTVNVYDDNGDLIDTATQSMAATDVGKKTYMHLGFSLSAGDHTIDTKGTIPSLLLSYGNTNYPYTSPLLDITGNSYSTNYFLYLFDWQIVNTVCQARTEVVVTTDATKCSADLSAEVEGPKKAAAGSEVEYTVVVRNEGPTASYDVVVNEMPSEGLTHLGNSGDCLTAFPCSVGTLKLGESKSITARYKISTSATGNVEFKAVASAMSSDAVSANDSDTQTTLVDSKANMQMSMTSNTDVIGTGGEIVLRMQIANHGPSDVGAATLETMLPTGLTLVATSGCDNDPEAAPDCSLGAMAVGSEKIVTVTAKAEDDAPPAVRVEARVSSDVPEGASGDESASLSVTIQGANIEDLDEEPPVVGPTASGGCALAQTGQPSDSHTPWFALALAGMVFAARRRRHRLGSQLAKVTGLLAAAAFFMTTGSAQAVTLPYVQNFDAFGSCTFSCSAACVLTEEWTNPASNMSSWLPNSNGTGSFDTGPSADHTSGAGKYLYVETSGCAGYNAHLLSPEIDLTGATNPVASFWQHMYGASMGDLHIDILDANNMSLKDDIIPVVSGNQGNSWAKKSIDLSAYIGQTIRIRFRGVIGTSFTSDMAIDDFEVKDLVPDVGVTAIKSPVTGGCGDTDQYVEVTVKNFGSAVKDVPIEVTLSGSVSAVLNTTIMGDFAVDATQTVQLGPVDLFAGGTIDIDAVTKLATDTNNANDAIQGSVDLLNSAIEVTPPSAMVCPGKQAVFQAKLESATNFEWYDALSGGNLLGTGPIFAAPGTLMTTSYYVGRIPTVAQSVGPLNPLFGNTQYLLDQGARLNFETQAAMTLEGVYVYPQTEGTVQVNLRDEFGVNTLSSTTQVIGPNDVGQKTYIQLDFYVPPGKFTLDNSGTDTLLRFNNTNVTYPYSSTFLEITSCTFAGNNYPNIYVYFYDWKVSNFVCKPRTKVEVVADGSLCEADLVTQVSGPATGSAGGEVEYTVIVRNNGPTGAYGVSVTDTPPEGFTHVKSTGDCETAFPCDLAAIQPGESQNFKATYAVGPSVSGTVEFKAKATSSSTDPDPTNNEGSAETLIESESDIELQLTANAKTIGVGANVELRVHVVNHGPATAKATKVSGDIPTGLTLVSSSGCDNDPSGAPECQLGDLEPGDEKIVTLTATADADAPRVVSYSATLSSDTVDPAPGKESSSLNIVINRGSTSEGTIVAPRSPGCGCHVVGGADSQSNRTPWGMLGLGLAAMAAAFRRRRHAA